MQYLQSRFALTAALTVATSASLFAQSFVAGDLWARGGVGSQSVVARIDGPGNWLPVLSGQLTSHTDDLHFDAYRARLVAAWQVSSSPFGLYEIDAAGTVDLVVGTGVMPGSIAPVGDGRVYMHVEGAAGGSFRCVDAAGVLHVLTDANTGQPWVPGFPFGGSSSGMAYDATSNALILAMRGNVNAGCGGNPAALILHKVPLAADGLRVVGPVTCLEPFSTYWGSVPDPVGFSRLPSGNLLLTTNVVTTNPVNAALLEIDPVAFTATAWAAPDFAGAHTIAAGTWSSAAGGACVIDVMNDRLHVYSQGGVGAGAVVPISASLNSVQLVEIPAHAAPCDGAFTSYGTGLAGTGGSVPQLGATGCPDVGQGFELLLSKGLGGGLAVFAFGLTSASVPLFGGTVLLGQIDLLVPVVLNGAVGVGGSGVAELPLAFSAPSAIGASLFVQGAVFDAGAAQGLALTAGLQITLGP
ncbi:MAG: hypothetical protein IT455_20035 [Planctomycetes bacterium]|nr:hypothetical protein [Planctomycetota bacterium]